VPAYQHTTTYGKTKSLGLFEAVFSGAMNEVCVFRYPGIKRRNFENETGKSRRQTSGGFGVVKYSPKGMAWFVSHTKVIEIKTVLYMCSVM
jgi:hypothetical protein